MGLPLPAAALNVIGNNRFTLCTMLDFGLLVRLSFCALADMQRLSALCPQDVCIHLGSHGRGFHGDPFSENAVVALVLVASEVGRSDGHRVAVVYTNGVAPTADIAVFAGTLHCACAGFTETVKVISMDAAEALQVTRY